MRILRYCSGRMNGAYLVQLLHKIFVILTPVNFYPSVPTFNFFTIHLFS